MTDVVLDPALEHDLERLIAGWRPRRAELRQRLISICGWMVAPGIMGEALRLVGNLRGHPLYADGHLGATDEVLWLDREAGLALARDGWYALGTRV